MEQHEIDAAVDWALMVGVARAIRRIREGSIVGAELCLQVAMWRAEAIQRMGARQ